MELVTPDRPIRVLHVAPTTGDGICDYAERYRTAVAAAGLHIHAPAVPVDASARSVARLVGNVTRAAGRYDIVHFELGGNCVAGLQAAVAAQRAGLTTVLTLHDPPHAVWRPFHTRGIARNRLASDTAAAALGPAARRLNRRLLARAAAVIVLSPTAARALRASGSARPERVHVLAYPIDADPAVLALPPPASPALILGFFGFWYRSKGLDTLLAALEPLTHGPRPVALRLWGDPLPDAGPRTGARYRDAVLAGIQRHHLAALVRVEGTLPSAQIAIALRCCDAVVLPYEWTPRTADLRSTSAAMFAALAAGTPVIASDVRALRDTLSTGRNGLLVPPGNVAALTRAITRLRDDPRLQAALRQGAEVTARALSSAATAAGAAEIYRRALAATAFAR